jgi:hypothetical protein
MTVRSTWSLRSLYLYAVCLITLVMVIFSAVGFVRAVVSLVYPDPGYYATIPIAPDGKGLADPAQYAQEQQKQQENQRQQATRQAVLSLVGNGAMLLLAGPLYLYHWRKIEHEVVPSRAS